MAADATVRRMPRHITSPTRVAALGSPPKLIDEYVGRVNTGTDVVSVARMTSPAGWSEPFQTPEFTEWTLVLEGTLRVDHEGGTTDVAAGEAIVVEAGERVRYSTPDGARYVAVCAPAFAPDLAHRDPEGS
jgi:quercetin dioxygenase-like cupin family protein